MSVIEKNISDEEFSIEDIATEIGMGRTQIYRKIKGLTGKSPSVYLRSVRLSAAQEMIHRREATISEISYKVGFSSPAYFSRCFKEEFGYSPSEE
ncbi:MAG: AraC family transcriptional regulator [Ignavibacteriaceae bacterium]